MQSLAKLAQTPKNVLRGMMYTSGGAPGCGHRLLEGYNQGQYFRLADDYESGQKTGEKDYEMADMCRKIASAFGR